MRSTQERWARGYARHQTTNHRHRVLQWQRRHDIPTVRLTFKTWLYVRLHERVGRALREETP